jgi:hypothetical protein
VLTRERARGIVALGFGLLLAIAVGLLLAGPSESVKLQWRHGRPVPDRLPPGVTVVDAAIPVAVAADTTAWTGRELLTFGSRGRENVGAVFEASSGRWRAMSPIPFGAVVEGARGVWTGRVWVVVGVLCDRAVIRDPGDPAPATCDPGALASAAYDPDADTWRVIDQNPEPAAAGFGPGRARPFGSALGMLGPDAVFVIDGQYYAFRPDRWDWHWLTPVVRTESSGCSTGRMLVRYRDGHALTLTPGARVWSTSDDQVPAGATPPVGSVCTDAGMFVYPGGLDAPAFYDVGSQRWEPVPRPTVPTTGVRPPAAFTGTSVVWTAPRTRAVAFDVATRSWREAPSGLTVAPADVAWTDAGYGLYVQGSRLAAYNPGP